MEAQRRSRGQRWNLITCIFCIKQTNEFALTSSMPGVIAQTIYLFSKANKVPFVLICSNLCSLAMFSYSPVFAQFWPFCTRGRMPGTPLSWWSAWCGRGPRPRVISPISQQTYCIDKYQSQISDETWLATFTASRGSGRPASLPRVWLPLQTRPRPRLPHRWETHKHTTQYDRKGAFAETSLYNLSFIFRLKTQNILFFTSHPKSLHRHPDGGTSEPL